MNVNCTRIKFQPIVSDVRYLYAIPARLVRKSSRIPILIASRTRYVYGETTTRGVCKKIFLLSTDH
jgi:hypothetical protein